MPNCIMRVDGATGFQSVLHKCHQQKNGIQIEISKINFGYVNLRYSNSHIQNRGLFAKEILT